MKRSENEERLAKFLEEISDDKTINTILLEILKLQDRTFNENIKEEKILALIHQNLDNWSLEK